MSYFITGPKYADSHVMDQMAEAQSAVRSPWSETTKDYGLRTFALEANWAGTYVVRY